MDGYASPLSSMVRDGLKVSIPTKKADHIVADLDILRNAPLPMLKAGLGDMLAKYVSICEWRLGALITGEAYDAGIADSVRNALRKCVDHADGLLHREDEAIRAVFEGLVLTGEAMEKAGCSRPASGAEHYFSHLWDMRWLEFGTPTDLHGIQCAAATRICVKLYHRLKDIRPDREKALQYVRAFDPDKWNKSLRQFLGQAAEPLIELEKREGKYNLQKHGERLRVIIARYDDILAVIDEELPSLEMIDALYQMLNLPTEPPEDGILKMTVKAGKDIRDKYVLPRLLWDLGVLDEFCDTIGD
jgi:glycerol-1-phosphate dehydrogenase [NAD(P)+]